MLLNSHYLQHAGSQYMHTSSSLHSCNRLVGEFPVRPLPVLQAELLHHHHSPRFKYDVFLSFHGNDTRNNFTNHLYSELIENFIEAYRDEEGIVRGTFIDPELMKAIKESKFAVVVLSENYAYSRWCLDELAQIVACIKETGLKVIPIFYHVDPSNVREQKGTFALTFAKHKEDSTVKSEEIQTWKDALKCVSDIAGHDVKDNTSESTVIQRISGDIKRELYGKFSTFTKELVGLVGMESCAEEMMELLGICCSTSSIVFSVSPL